MSYRTQEQQDAITRFELDYFPALSRGILSADIVRSMKLDFAIIKAEPEVELAVPVETSAPEIPPIDIEPAVEMIGIRDEEPPKTKRGK